MNDHHTPISQQAFSIYCDEVARDVAAKNQALRLENESLQAARNMLLCVQIYHPNGSLLKEIDLLREGPIDDSSTQWSFSVDPVELTLEEACCLYARISGVIPPPDLFGYLMNPPRINVLDDETLEVEIFLSTTDIVSFTGSLENISGTIEQVNNMVHGNRVGSYFIELNSTDLTGQPVERSDDCLDGYTFLFKKVKLAKAALHPTLVARNNDLEDAHVLSEDDELQILCKANVAHQGLGLVMNERKALETSNVSLKSSRNLLASMEACYPVDDALHSLHWDLQDGRLACVMGDDPAWILEPPVEATIPVSSISRFRLKLANMPWSFHLPLVAMRPRFTRDDVMILNYSPAITAFFVFDESLNDAGDLDSFHGGLLGYIFHLLESGGSHNITLRNYHGPRPELTMRLLLLKIDLPWIREHLDVLGIETGANGDEQS